MGNNVINDYFCRCCCLTEVWCDVWMCILKQSVWLQDDGKVGGRSGAGGPWGGRGRNLGKKGIRGVDMEKKKKNLLESSPGQVSANFTFLPYMDMPWSCDSSLLLSLFLITLSSSSSVSLVISSGWVAGEAGFWMAFLAFLSKSQKYICDNKSILNLRGTLLSLQSAQQLDR